MLTIHELQEKIIEQIDEVDIIDLLGLTTADIVYSFVDRVEDRREAIEDQLTLDDY